MPQTLIAVALAGQAVLAQAEPDAGAEPTPPPVRATEERIDAIEGKLEALDDQLSATAAGAGILKKIKFSGYIQGRFTVNDTSKSGATTSPTGPVSPNVTDGFAVRRGRFKTTYTGSWSQYVLQIDATGAGVNLTDAEATFFEPWSGKRLALTLGQTKWPFSYEVIQSSGDREFPERTRVVRAFASRERDRGVKASGKVGPVFFGLGVFDGNGTDSRTFVNVDNDRHKDVVGRIGVDLDVVSFAVSGWHGETRQHRTTSTPKEDFDRQRIGADLQLDVDVLPIGGTAIKAEYIQGETYMQNRVEQFGKKARGWYALLVQDLDTWGALAVRYDVFDGDTEADSAADAADATKPARHNPVATLGFAFLYHLDESLKLTLAYEILTTDTPSGVDDPKDNVFTAQLQAKF